MELEKLYATLGRMDFRIDGLQFELQRLGQARGQLIQQIQNAEQAAARMTAGTTEKLEMKEAPAE